MNILVANHLLRQTGGTQNYTYALIVELLRLGHQVEYFTFKKGIVSRKIEELGVRYKSRSQYDLILANHNTSLELLHRNGLIIQTCHGMLPALEQPSKYADAYVSVTREVYNHLKSKGVTSTIIHNGIDCRRFKPTRELNPQLRCVLSLCQTDEANALIEEVCRQQQLRFMTADKRLHNVWEIEDLINQADMVVGIGRSLYDAMACGRTVVSFDQRSYSTALGDGYLHSGNVVKALEHNCSGRGAGRKMDAPALAEEFKHYNPADGQFLREFALQELNIEKAVQQYLAIAQQHGPKQSRPVNYLYAKYLHLKGRLA